VRRERRLRETTSFGVYGIVAVVVNPLLHDGSFGRSCGRIRARWGKTRYLGMTKPSEAVNFLT
jgi:hypothetical protein